MKRIQICMLGLLLATPGVTFCADLETLTENCSGCHGPQGVSADGDIPTIAGQKAEFITASLESFQERGRPCLTNAYRHGDTTRPPTSMCDIAADLSDEDIVALGAYYSGLVFVPAVQEFDPALVISGEQLYGDNCASCHPQGGTVADRGPILAGQWMPYLQRAMHQSMTGEHLVPPLMERALTSYSTEEINALLNFFASQQN